MTRFEIHTLDRFGNLPPLIPDQSKFTAAGREKASRDETEVESLTPLLTVALCTRPLAAAMGNVTTRLLAERAGPVEALCLAYCGLAIVTALLVKPGEWIGVILRRPLACILRAGLMALSMWAFTESLLRMPLSTAVALVQCTPFFVVIFAAAAGRERLALWTLAPLALCAIGVAVIVDPDVPSSIIGACLALGASAASALSVVITRNLVLGEDTMPVATATTCLMAVVLLVAGGFQLPELSLLVLSYAAATVFLLFAAEVGLIILLARLPATVVTPFHYLRVVWATLLGAAIFSEVPSLQELAGIVLVVGSLFSILFMKKRELAAGP